MSGEDASELQDDGRLSAGIVAAGRVGGGVGDETSARIVVAADYDQPIAMFSGKPGDYVEGWCGRAGCMNKWVQPNLQPRDGLVLTEDKIAGGGDAVSGFGLVRAGLACSEVLQRLCGVENAVGIYVAEDGGNVGVGRQAARGTKADEQERNYDE